MRTTIRLDDDLMLAAKQHGVATQRTLTRLIHDALLALLERERGRMSPRKVRLPVFRGDGVFEGIDINNSAALVDRMESGK